VKCSPERGFCFYCAFAVFSRSKNYVKSPYSFCVIIVPSIKSNYRNRLRILKITDEAKTIFIQIRVFFASVVRAKKMSPGARSDSAVLAQLR